MFNFASITPAITKVAGKISLELTKHSPEILTYGGLALMTAGTATTAVKSVRYLEDVTEPSFVDLAQCAQVFEDSEAGKTIDKYTKKMYKQDKIVIYGRLLVKTVKHYALPIFLTTAGAASIIAGHRILAKRFAGAMAAYGTLQVAYENLKKKVEDNVDQETLDRITAPEIDRDEETGKVQLKKIVDPYVYIFDSTNVNFSTKEMNENFLRSNQRFLNDRLQARGYLFLNEVLETLGLPESRMGQIVGWTTDGPDGYVSFGVSGGWNERIDNDGEYCTDYLLDFNVQGMILDDIKEY